MKGIEKSTVRKLGRFHIVMASVQFKPVLAKENIQKKRLKHLP